MLRAILNVTSIVVSLALLSYLLTWVDIRAGWGALSSMPVYTVVAVFLAMAASVVLGAARLALMARDVGHPLRLSTAVTAVAMGQLAGAAFFQLAGQLIARGALLKQSGVPISASVYVTLYERVLALAVSVLLALTGAVYLFGFVQIDIKRGGNQFFILIAGIICAFGFSAILAWGRDAMRTVRSLNADEYLRIARNLAITLAIHACTMIAFVIMAWALVPTTSLIQLAAASAIVMFASSIPISMAGWGVRELTAVVALGAIGFPASVAVAAGVILGLIALATNGIMSFAWVFNNRPAIAATQNATIGVDRSKAFLGQALPTMAGILVLFQAQAPIGSEIINLNLADPLVLVGTAIFIASWAPQWPVWRLERLNLYIGLITGVMIAGFLHGFLVLGWSQWAAVNKLFGWVVLLSYGMTGALVVRAAGAYGLSILLKTIVAGIVGIIAIEILNDLIRIAGWKGYMHRSRIEGFAYDANAFAFQIMLCLCILFPMVGSWPERKVWRPAGLLFTVCVVGLVAAGSRGSWGASALVFVAVCLMQPSRIRKVALPIVLGAFAGFILIAEFQKVYSNIPATSIAEVLVREDRTFSTTERVKTVRAGLDMFLQSPIFGNGLGYFIETFGTARRTIDSTPIWILAEFGLTGLLAFVLPFWLMLKAEWVRARSGDPTAFTIVLILVTFAAMSQFYDLLYQRPFWLILGGLLAFRPYAKENSKTTPELRRRTS